MPSRQRLSWQFAMNKQSTRAWRDDPIAELHCSSYLLGLGTEFPWNPVTPILYAIKICFVEVEWNIEKIKKARRTDNPRPLWRWW